ncbi:hypothetical protein [Sorangium sp. So ce693]|uniref:hypothetical protein n=1 Tax=Sorangium sp. So ce693 TaxID=3133318 RepID=UPI003F5EBFD6
MFELFGEDVSLKRAFVGEFNQSISMVHHVEFETWYCPARDPQGDVTGVVDLSWNLTATKHIDVPKALFPVEQSRRQQETIRDSPAPSSRSGIACSRPTVAQTMVSLGIDMSRMTTLADLRRGIEYCMNSLAAEVAAWQGAHELTELEASDSFLGCTSPDVDICGGSSTGQMPDAAVLPA